MPLNNLYRAPACLAIIRVLRAVVLPLAGCGTLVLVAQTAFAQAPPPDSKTQAFWNPVLPVEERVNDLISKMTLEEKTSQLLSVSPAIPRLGVPAYNYWSEALHGVGNDGAATVFPQAIGFAATWNTQLVHSMADAISTEARARYHEAIRNDRRVQSEGLTFWSPNINIFRDPRWGRGQETYGEDPFLTSQIGVAFVTGLQGDDPRYLKVLSTPKHYAVHSGPEPARHTIDVPASAHDLWDTYLPAFRATVVNGHAGSVMCAYNAVNGEPDCANKFLLEDTLRRDWGFRGYVVSDCQAITDIYANHKYARDIEAAATVSLKRGTDLDCDFTQTENAGYLDALKKGDLTVAEVDNALRRIYTARFRLGMFDPPEMVKYASIPFRENDSEEHRKLALEVARQSMVLLKNDGILPLKSSIHKIAVIGPLGDSLSALLGNYNGMPSRYTTVIDGIRQSFPGVLVSYVPGTSFLRTPFPVPSTAFSTESGQPGLTAEYFKSRDLSGDPAVVRIDSQVSFGFGVDHIPQWAELDGYTARWVGRIASPEPGTYKLQLIGGGGARVWIDDRLVIDDWKENQNPPASNRTLSLSFEKGKQHRIKLEYLRFEQEKVQEFPRRLTSGIQLVWIREGGEALKDAMAIVDQADAVVGVVGITADLESEENGATDLPEGFKGGDRTNLDLPKPEEDLLEAVKTAHKPLVVVLMSGSALSANWVNENADAVLQAWYPGEEGGLAVGETLAGINNPAGRLPVTFYRSVSDLPAFTDYSMAHRTYRYFRGPVLYPFGFGLSYSRFSYANLTLSPKAIQAGGSLAIGVDVENISSLQGDEVVELYQSYPGRAEAPIRVLRGFQRISLAPGETRHVQFELDSRDLSWVDSDGDRIVSDGTFEIFVGGAQPGENTSGLSGTFSIQGTMKLPR
jgi:beta-glucosidase